MTPTEVERIAKLLFGEGWKKKLPVALGLDFTTLWRQLKDNRISGPVASTLKAWELIFNSLRLIPPIKPGEEFRKALPPKNPRKLTSYAKAMLEDD